MNRRGNIFLPGVPAPRVSVWERNRCPSFPGRPGVPVIFNNPVVDQGNGMTTAHMGVGVFYHWGDRGWPSGYAKPRLERESLPRVRCSSRLAIPATLATSRQPLLLINHGDSAGSQPRYSRTFNPQKRTSYAPKTGVTHYSAHSLSPIFIKFNPGRLVQLTDNYFNQGLRRFRFHSSGSGASNITRITGSVPRGRTRTWPCPKRSFAQQSRRR